MFVSIVSLLLILIEISLGAKMISGIFVLSYLFYLVDKWDRWIIAPIIGTILIHSLQTQKISIVLGVFLILFLCYFIMLHYMDYTREGILMFSILQTVIIIVIFRANIGIAEIIYNFIGLNLMNYFYIVQIKGKSGRI